MVDSRKGESMVWQKENRTCSRRHEGPSFECKKIVCEKDSSTPSQARKASGAGLGDCILDHEMQEGDEGITEGGGIQFKSKLIKFFRKYNYFIYFPFCKKLD